jgi:ketose-bisphosphate aldolase
MNLKEKLKECRKNKKALLAANFYNFETLHAVIQAAKETESQIILQASESTLKYLGINTAANMAKAALKENNVTGWLHFDHGATIDLVRQCLDAGFDSVMIDASEASFKENIKTTLQVVKIAATYNANVEAELGYVAKLGQDQNLPMFTQPEEAKIFVDETGINALAVAIGNAHGFYKSAPQIQFELLKKISEVVAIPIVLHGSSGIPEKDLQKSIQLGICKINLATEIKNAFMKKLKSVLIENEDIDLRNVFPKATKEATALIVNKLNHINAALI